MEETLVTTTPATPTAMNASSDNFPTEFPSRFKCSSFGMYFDEKLLSWSKTERCERQIRAYRANFGGFTVVILLFSMLRTDTLLKPYSYP
jgi:hypothetical protein